MRLAALLLPLLLTACGFQLRGASVLPPDMGRLQVKASDALREEVAIFLEGSETTIVEDGATADVVLTMTNARFDRRVLSVDPTTGKDREFELAYTVDVAAKGPNGKVIMERRPVTLIRDYVFDPRTLIGSSTEESVLREEMQRDLVQQVLYQLRAVTAG